MKFDYSKLSGRIVEKFGTRKAFVEALGKTSSWLSARMVGPTPFTDAEIMRMCEEDLLDIEPQDIPTYFFTV